MMCGVVLNSSHFDGLHPCPEFLQRLYYFFFVCSVLRITDVVFRVRFHSFVRAGGANVWAVTPEEREKYDKQFDALAPVLGYVSGRPSPHTEVISC